MAAPKPGATARGSRTGRPLMAVLDLLGRRWSLRILWELHMSGPSSFRDLQRLCGDISPTVLNTRLAELRVTGIIELREKGGYAFTEHASNSAPSSSRSGTGPSAGPGAWKPASPGRRQA